MSNNKRAKEILIKKYGAVCFIERLKLRKEPRIYKSKKQYKKMKQLTYHHIIEKQFGGETTEDNGALLSVENHEWLHQQTEERKQEINDMLQELKVEYVDELDTRYQVLPKVITFDEKGRIIEKVVEKGER